MTELIVTKGLLITKEDVSKLEQVLKEKKAIERWQYHSETKWSGGILVFDGVYGDTVLATNDESFERIVGGNFSHEFDKVTVFVPNMGGYPLGMWYGQSHGNLGTVHTDRIHEHLERGMPRVERNEYGVISTERLHGGPFDGGALGDRFVSTFMNVVRTAMQGELLTKGQDVSEQIEVFREEEIRAKHDKETGRNSIDSFIKVYHHVNFVPTGMATGVYTEQVVDIDGLPTTDVDGYTEHQVGYSYPTDFSERKNPVDFVFEGQESGKRIVLPRKGSLHYCGEPLTDSVALRDTESGVEIPMGTLEHEERDIVRAWGYSECFTFRKFVRDYVLTKLAESSGSRENFE